MIGNAFHTELVRTLFAEMEPPLVAERTSSIHTVQADRQDDGTPKMSKQETQLIEMSDEKPEKVLKARLGTEGLARLKLVMSAENTAPHQTLRRARYQTPSKLVPAVIKQ